MKMTEQETPL